MSGKARIALLLLAVALLFGAAGVFVVSRFVQPEELRRSVAVEMAALTGQPVTISGRTRFSMFPWPAVRVESVQIGSDQGASAVVEAGELEARLSPLGLLAGRTEVTGLHFDRARLMLVVDAQGRSNWRSGTSILSMMVAEPGGTGGAAGRLGELSLRNSTITYRDDQARRRTDLSDVDITVSWPALSSRLSATGRFRLRGEEIRFQGSMDRPAALFARDISPLELTLETAALRAQLTGNALAAREIQIEGNVTFTSPTLRRLFAWLVPEARNAPDVGPVQGAARIKILDRTMTLEAARLTVDRARGEGTLALTFDRTRTQVQGTMDFDQLDVRPLMRTQMAGGEDPVTWFAEEVRPETIGPVDIDLRVSADTLVLGATTIRTAALSLLTRDGRVEAGLADGQAYGGRVSARLITEARSTGGIRSRLIASATQVRLDDALRELLGVIRVSGTSTLNLTLQGEGASRRDVIASLRGEASGTIVQGTLTGIDLAALMRRAERSPVDALLEARGGRTVVEEAAATFRIENGAARTEEATIRGPGYAVAVRGAVEITERRLNFAGVVAQPPHADPQRPVVELPFVIRGPWLDPVIAPASENLIRRVPAGTNRLQ